MGPEFVLYVILAGTKTKMSDTIPFKDGTACMTAEKRINEAYAFGSTRAFCFNVGTRPAALPKVEN